MNDFAYLGFLPQSQFQVSDVSLRVEINNKKPVELLYLTDSLVSLSNEYRRHLSEHNIPYNQESRLYVRKIESGSIITELVNQLPVAIQYAQEVDVIKNADVVIAFVGFLKYVYKYYSKPKGVKPECSTQTLKNLSSIVAPVANDSASQMNISAINVQSGATINIYNLNSDTANAATNRMSEEIISLEKPQLTIAEKVVLSIHQAVNGSPSASDKGIIESISANPLHIIWPDEIKPLAIHTEKNFFEISFLVDVEVHTVRGKPKAYKVLKFHKILE